MLADALVVVPCVAAFQATLCALFPRVRFLECVAVAPALGLSLAAWVALVLKSLPFAAPGISSGVVVGTLLASVACCVALLPRSLAVVREHKSRIAWELREHRVFLAILAVMVVYWAHLNHIHYLPKMGSSYVTAGSVYADLPFHLNLMSSFVHGCNMNATVTSSLLSPFYAGETLAYPFLPDFFCGVMIAAGSTIQWSLVLPGTVLIEAMMALMYLFSFRVTNSTTAAALSVFFTLLAGGMGGFVWAWKNPLWFTTLTSWDFMHGPDHVLYWVDKDSAYWFSLPAHILFPQRTVQHAYPLALTALLAVCIAVEGRKLDKEKEDKPDKPVEASPRRGKGGAAKNKRPRPSFSPPSFDDPPSLFLPAFERRLFVFAGIATGLLPLMQPHSFISIGVVILVVAACQTLGLLVSAGIANTVPVVAHWIVFGVVSFGIGLPQFFKHFFHRVTFGTGKAQAFVRLATVWDEENKGEGPVTMWLRALGLFVPLYLLSVLVLRTKQQRWLYAGFLLLFVVCNCVMFQPWHLDNTKLFYVWMFGASPFVGLLVARALDAAARAQAGGARLLVRLAVCCVCLSLVFSGSLALWREHVNKARVFDDNDFEFGEWLVANTDPTSVMLHEVDVDPPHIRPESALAGRQVVYGFEGWLHSHGINYGPRRVEVDSVVQGKSGAPQALFDFNITHIVVDQARLDRFNWEFLNEVGDPVVLGSKFSVYEVIPELRERRLPVRDCGKVGITEEECRAKGCWYFVGARNGPWCQNRPYIPVVENCAPPEQTAQSCRQQGCLWYPGHHIAQCHKPRHMILRRTVPRLGRRPGSDCGWSTITPQQCVDRGCKWDPQPGRPFCTFT